MELKKDMEICSHCGKPIGKWDGKVKTRRGNIVCSECWNETDECVR